MRASRPTHLPSPCAVSLILAAGSDPDEVLAAIRQADEALQKAATDHEILVVGGDVSGAVAGNGHQPARPLAALWPAG